MEKVLHRKRLLGLKERLTRILWEQDRRTRLAQQSTGVGTFEWNIPQNLVTWSPELERLYGLPPGSFGGRYEAWAARVHPDDWPEAERQHQRALSSGRMEAEWRVVWPDGSVHWLAGRGTVEMDAAGKPVRMLGVNIDITDRKRAEETLRENETRLRLAIEIAELGTYERDLLTNQFTLNTTCRRILGVSGEQLPPDVAYRSVHPEDKERIFAAVARAFDPQLREVCAGEFRVVRPDGSLRWVAGRGRVLFDDSVIPARPARFIGVLNDITERKKAEVQLKRRNQHLDLLHGAAADLLLGRAPVDLIGALHEQIARNLGTEVFMFYMATPGNSHFHLQACSGVTQEQEQKLKTLRYGRAICAKPAEALQPIIATHLQSGQAPNRRFVRKLGLQSYLYYPLIVDGSLQGTLAFGSRERPDYDPTDLEFFHTIARTLAEALQRQRLESELKLHATNLEELVRERTAKLQDALAELEHMSYSMVHDMRAPLRAMQSFAQMMQDECNSSLQLPVVEYLNRIRAASSRLDRLITGALNYNKVVRENLPLTPVDLGKLLRSMLQTYPNLQPSGADIKIELTRLVVLGNESLLTQCFGNLLDNAVKFVSPGVKPRVRVWAEEVRSPDSGMQGQQEVHSENGPHTSHRATLPSLDREPATMSYVRLWVEDNGIGIPKAAQEKIFRMFQRVHRESEYPGTGIGLTIVRKAVERMNGRITLDSEPGKGSRFCIELPQPTPAQLTGLGDT